MKRRLEIGWISVGTLLFVLGMLGDVQAQGPYASQIQQALRAFTLAPKLSGQWTVNGSLCAAGQVLQGGSPTICTATPTVTTLVVNSATGGMLKADTSIEAAGLAIRKPDDSGYSALRVTNLMIANTGSLLTVSNGGFANVADAQWQIANAGNTSQLRISTNALMLSHEAGANYLAANGSSVFYFGNEATSTGGNWDMSVANQATFRNIAKSADGTIKGGTINATAAYQVNGVAGASGTCADVTVTNGLVTTCGGSASTPTAANVGANSCGTTGATVAGTEATGVVTVGATSGTQCRLTFATAAVARRQCVVTNETTANLARTTYVDTTHSDFSGTFVGGDKLSYICATY